VGYNSVVVVLNDALDQIKNDKQFGRNVAEAISDANCYGRSVDISSGNHGNAASVVSCEHADVTQLVAVGGNYGMVLCRTGYVGQSTEHGKILLLKALADELGYRVSKKPAVK
jgi:hypothetical protein